jgi:hypothetical protein
LIKITKHRWDSAELETLDASLPERDESFKMKFDKKVCLNIAIWTFIAFKRKVNEEMKPNMCKHMLTEHI